MRTRRRRGLLLLSLALASGGLAAAEVRERERSVEARVGPDLPVLVAARDLRAGARVSPTAVAVRRIPARFAPPGSFAAPGDVAGARLAVPVPAGTYLTAVLLRGRSTTPGQESGLRRGERAVTVRVAGAAAGALEPGALVDVLVSTESPAGGGRTMLALPGVELLALTAGEGGTPSYPAPEGELHPSASAGPTALATLRVTLREAVYLTEADNFAREIRLLARP